MTHKKLMYYPGSVMQMAWLVWEMKNDRPTLAVICTTDDDLARYVSPDKKSWARGGPVFVEKVCMDHLYGANDTRIAMGLLRNAGH
jgi:hypothetical protein